MMYIVRSDGGWTEKHYTDIDEAIEAILDLTDTISLYNEMLDECYGAMDFGGFCGKLYASEVLERCDPVAYRVGMSEYDDQLREDIREELKACEDVILGVSVEYDENADGENASA